MKVTVPGQCSHTDKALVTAASSDHKAAQRRPAGVTPLREAELQLGGKREGRSGGVTHDWWSVNRRGGTPGFMGLWPLRCAALKASCSSSGSYLQPVTNELRLEVKKRICEACFCQMMHPLSLCRQGAYKQNFFLFFFYQQLINSTRSPKCH